MRKSGSWRPRSLPATWKRRARTLDIDPEDALRYTNAKFVRRFKFVESELAARGKTPSQSDLGEMDGLWEEAKRIERAQAAKPA